MWLFARGYGLHIYKTRFCNYWLSLLSQNCFLTIIETSHVHRPSSVSISLRYGMGEFHNIGRRRILCKHFITYLAKVAATGHTIPLSFGIHRNHQKKFLQQLDLCLVSALQTIDHQLWLRIMRISEKTISQGSHVALCTSTPTLTSCKLLSKHVQSKASYKYKTISPQLNDLTINYTPTTINLCW